MELVGRAIANTVYLSNVEYSSLRLGAGAGYSTSGRLSDPVSEVKFGLSENFVRIYF